MVASVSALSSAGQAASYYEADDYYAEGGMAPSEWFGEATEKLGVSGDVDREQFAEMLEGRIVGQQLGTTRDGKVEHRPGWDITLSAPKSVSIMAEVAGDKRLIKAHSAAVKVALAHVEKHMAATRIRQGGEVRREATGNLAIATFRHATSRAQDPQLHTHAVVINATQDRDGNWRSLEPRAFYQLQKEIGAIYRQELAHGVAALGYRIEAGKDSLFEIAGVPEKAIDALSQRTEAIDARLAERGTSRADASAAEKQIAALDTREAKTSADHRSLRADWRATADANRFDKAARDKLISEARERTKSSEATASPELLARQAVAWAAAKLSEREAVFSASALAREAGDYTFGKAGHGAISVAIAEAGERGELVPRTFLDRRGVEFAGFTTPQAIATERAMLRLEEAGRGMAQSLATPVAAARTIERAARQSARSGYAWTEDQKRATADLLTSRDRVAAVQGYAGTAKTTTVLATYAREASLYSFWWEEGRSKKRTGSGGSHGVGKSTLSGASNSNAFLALTRRSGGDELLIGYSILPPHELGPKEYLGYARFGKRVIRSSDGASVIYPYTGSQDGEVLERFRKHAAPRRTNENGLSVFIPDVRDEINEGSLLQAVVENFFFPIIKQSLVAEICNAATGQSVLVEKSNILSLVEDGDYSEEFRSTIEVSLEATRLASKNEFFFLRSDFGLSSENTLSAEAFSDANVKKMQEAFENGDVVSARIEIPLTLSDGKTVSGYADLFARGGEKGGSKTYKAFRGNILIEKEKCRAAQPFSVLILDIFNDDEGNELSEYMKYAEDPGHTEWKNSAQRRSQGRYPGSETWQRHLVQKLGSAFIAILTGTDVHIDVRKVAEAAQ